MNEYNKRPHVNSQIIQSCQTDYYLPVTDVKFAGLKTTTLIDTGASVSLLHISVFEKIRHDPSIKLASSFVKVKTISGNNIDIIGCYTIPITLGNKQIRHVFYITSNALPPQYNAVIGYDILKKHKFTIRLDKDTLESHNTVLKIRDANSTHFNNVSTEFARLITKVTLLPQESKCVNLKLDIPVKQGDYILFTPTFTKDDIELHNAVCTVDDDKTINVIISNLSTHKIAINKNTRLGSISNDIEIRDIEAIKKLRRQELKPTDFNLEHLNPPTRKKLLELLYEFSDIFSKRLYTIGRTEALHPNLHLDSSKLPSTRPYNVPYALRDELKRQLDELEAAQLIEKSDSHISFPLIMIKKKNPSGDPKQQKWRLVVDYRALNSHLKYPRHTLPTINHLLENLRGSKLYTSLDLASSFWQIPLKPEDRNMTTFSSPFGSYRYTTMPQGLSASPETFCKLSDMILAPLTELKISNYIDDFCIGSDDVSGMLFKLRKLFERFRQFGLTINPTKCSFLVPKIEFLGHMLDAAGIRPIHTNLRKITDFPTPTTPKKIRRFIGLIGYYRRFIPNFSEISAPLTDLTKKRQKFRWSPEAQTAFDILKSKLAETPILIHPDFNKEFILSTDSSDFALGAMLGQRDKFNIIHPIAYFSKKLNPTQLKYTIMEKELMAIVESIKSFKYYLYGRSFTIRCDNAALTKLSKLESPGNRLARWFAFLSDYNYKFELIKSAENQVADAFSRDFHVNSLQISLPNIEDIKAAQRTDRNLISIISDLENGAIFYPQAKPHYKLSKENGLLMHVSFIPHNGKTRKINQIVIPDKYKPHILAANHLSHFGHLKTYYAIREKYFWKNLYRDTKHYVQSCKHCMSFKSPNKFSPIPLQRHYIPTRPMEYVSCDFIGKLPTTLKGNSYILTFVDHFTKFIKLYAVSNQTAQTTAEKFLDFACIFGFPRYLLSDRGTNFTSDLFKNLCSRLGVTKLQTTALNPRCNGSAEVINLNIKKSISIFAQDTGQWDEYINYYELLYNSTMHSSTHEKPAFLHLAYDPLLPMDILTQSETPKTPTYPDFISDKVSKLQYTYRRVQQNLHTAAERQETYQHKFAKYRNFYVGQLVYLYAPDVDKSCLPKKKNYIGPFRVLKIHNRVNYSIIDINNVKAKPMKVNAHRLIPYAERRTDLDYLQQTIANDTMRDRPTPQKSRPKRSPQFEDLTDDDLIVQSAYDFRRRNVPTVSPSPAPILHSPSTIKRPQVTVSPPTKSTGNSSRNPQHSYSLRSRNPPPVISSNIANRLLDWGLRVTEQPAIELPEIFTRLADTLTSHATNTEK